MSQALKDVLHFTSQKGGSGGIEGKKEEYVKDMKVSKCTAPKENGKQFVLAGAQGQKQIRAQSLRETLV